jgi:hypothetical protein
VQESIQPEDKNIRPIRIRAIITTIFTASPLALDCGTLDFKLAGVLAGAKDVFSRP